MSCYISIYKKGSTKNVRGVDCDIKRICINDWRKYSEDGWVKNVQDLKPRKTRSDRKSK